MVDGIMVDTSERARSQGDAESQRGFGHEAQIFRQLGLSRASLDPVGTILVSSKNTATGTSKDLPLVPHLQVPPPLNIVLLKTKLPI